MTDLSPESNRRAHINSMLCTAIEHMDLDKIRELIGRGADMHAPRVDGYPALYRATKLPDTNVMALLLQLGGDINMKTDGCITPLMVATNNKNIGMIEFLLKQGADASAKDFSACNALLRAAVGDAHDAHGVLKALLKHNPELVDSQDNRGRTALMLTAERGRVQMVSTLLKHGADMYKADNAGMQPLVTAVKRGMTDVVRLFIAEKHDMKKLTMTPLIMALDMRNGGQMLKMLLDAGVDVEQKNAKENVPLVHAINSGNEDLIKPLLTAGANPNAKDRDGKPALICAVNDRKISIALLLIEHGADVNAVGINGETALIQTACNINFNVKGLVNALLEKGADIYKVRKYDGVTALSAAATNLNEVIVDILLQEHGDSMPADYLRHAQAEAMEYAKAEAMEWKRTEMATRLADRLLSCTARQTLDTSGNVNTIQPVRRRL